MSPATVKKLNQINKDFYKDTAKFFDSSRQYSWEGWDILWEQIKNNQIKTVLDIGCGNGRFLKFLESKGWVGEYLGIDNSEQLLSYANSQKYKSETKFENVDILDPFFQKQKDKNKSIKYDLIVAFGVMHHIPSFENRLNFIKFIKSSLTPQNGVAAVTFWKFLDSEKYKQRIVDWSLVSIDSSQLEENDFLLDWKRGVESLRYCHYVSEDEEGLLISEAKLSILKKYFADGKDGKLNKYLLFL